PDFLLKPEKFWPKKETEGEVQIELRPKYVHVHTKKGTHNLSIKFEGMLQWKRTMAFVIRFVNNVKAKIDKSGNATRTGFLTLSELQAGENMLYRMAQWDVFAPDIHQLQLDSHPNGRRPSVEKSSSLYRYSPYLDHAGVLRMRGRIDAASNVSIDQKRPIILPSQHEITDLVVKEYHIQYKHHNTETGSSNGNKPPGIFPPSPTTLRGNWRYAQQIANEFWRKWVKHYMPMITRRTKWFDDVKPVEVGDQVIIVDENAPRNMWSRGVVVETLKTGSDGRISRVNVRTIDGIYTRPVSKLAVLDLQRQEAKTLTGGGQAPHSSSRARPITNVNQNTSKFIVSKFIKDPPPRLSFTFIHVHKSIVNALVASIYKLASLSLDLLVLEYGQNRKQRYVGLFAIERYVGFLSQLIWKLRRLRHKLMKFASSPNIHFRLETENIPDIPVIETILGSERAVEKIMSTHTCLQWWGAKKERCKIKRRYIVLNKYLQIN
ncbi:hypothetical protein Bhyg_13420, partial [Pseudolycoriella hygida]